VNFPSSCNNNTLIVTHTGLTPTNSDPCSIRLTAESRSQHLEDSSQHTVVSSQHEKFYLETAHCGLPTADPRP
jgi:hypothetical protein